MSNIAKLKKRAGEFEQKKQFDKALSVYMQLLEELGGRVEEADVVLYNRVGDLLLRQGSVREAVAYYEQAVDLYIDGGFFNNAIALCNKIRRNDPERSSVYLKLGQISARKGFVADARQHFLEYADRMQRTGNLDEAFRALTEFADLCPDQDDVRLMLAERLVQGDRKEDAIAQLQALYDKFLADGRSTEARATAERMKAIDPDVMPRTTPTSPAGKSTDLVFLDVGLEGHRAAWGGVSPQAPRAEPSPADSVEEPASNPPEGPDLPMLEIDFGATEAAPLPTTVPGGAALPEAIHLPNAGAELVAGVERISFDAGPSLPPILPRLDLEPTALDTPAFAPDTWDTGGQEPPALAEPVQETGEGVNDSLTLDTFEPHAILEDDPHTTPTPLCVISADDALPRAATKTTRRATPADEGGLAFLEPEPQGDATPAGTLLPELSDDGFSASSADAVLPVPIELEKEQTAFLSDPPEATVDSAEPVVRPVALEGSNPAGPTPGRGDGEREADGAQVGEADREMEVRRLEAAMRAHEEAHDFAEALVIAGRLLELQPGSVRLRQKCVEYAFRAGDKPRLVEAYLALADCLFNDGQRDKARAVYVRVLELAPENEGARAALRSAAERGSSDAGAERSDGSSTSVASTTEVSRVASGSARAVTPSGMDRATHSGGDETFVDLAEWLREDEARRSTRMVVDVQEPARDDQADLAETLSMFKQGVAANVDDSDYASHYDLGIAYKEMGLLDEAIAQFQKALRSPEQRVRTYEALGQCFIEKGQFQIALTVLSRALADKSYTDEMLVGVLYLLGQASEVLGRWPDARLYYERVFAADIQFRDVGERLSAVDRAAG